MRNLKRVLSLALAAMMLMGMMVVGASAANAKDFTDADEIQNTEAVSTLVTLNVINGKEDGSYFAPNDIVSRAEMAKMITVVLNGGVDPVLGVKDTPSFSDIDGHWAESYIEYCTSSALGIISGRGDGTFDPDATVTAAEAAKMLLVALGYDADVFNLTGNNWQINTDVNANNAKLYEGLDLTSSTPLTRDNAAQMIYNALDAYIMEKSYDKVLSNGQISYNYDLSEYKTLLNHTYGVYKVEGIVVANEYADLGLDNSTTKAGVSALIVTNPDELRTGSNTYALTVNTGLNDDHRAYDKTNNFNVSTGKDELGHTVTLFVRPATTSSATTRATVIGDPIITSDSIEVTKTANMKTASAVTNWLKDNGMKLDGDSILATDYYADFDNAMDAADLINLGNGATVKAIDNDNDGKVEFVLVTNYVFTKVASINTSSETVTLTGYAAFDAEDVVAYEGMAKNDYVLYNEAGGINYITKPVTISGEISAYTNNGTDQDSITIDGTKLSISGIEIKAAESAWNVISTGENNRLPTINWTNSLIGTETTIYLDANGYAAVMGDSSALSADNVCLVVANEAANVIGTGRQVYVYFADGTSGVYNVTSVNGSSEGMSAAIGTDYAICSYQMNDKGIDLTVGDDLNVTGQTGTVTTDAGEALAIASKGQSQLTIGGTTAYANSQTVYFLVDSRKGLDDKDHVTVVTGMDSMGANTYTANDPIDLAMSSNNAAGAQIVYNIVNGVNNAVAVMGVKDSASVSAYISDLIFVVDTAYEMNGDTKQINVIMPGETEVTKLTVDKAEGGNGAVAVGLYEYTVDANNVYDLNLVAYAGSTADPTYKGEINCVNDDVVYLGNAQKALTSDTLIIDITDSDDPIVLSAADLRTGVVPYGYVCYNGGNDEITAIFVTGFFTGLETFGGQTVTVTDGMGTKGDPLQVAVTGTTGFVFDTEDTNKLTDGYTYASGAYNVDVQVFSDTGFSTEATGITTGTNYVTVSADNADTVYYEITVS